MRGKAHHRAKAVSAGDPGADGAGLWQKDPAPVLRGGGKRSAAPTEKQQLSLLSMVEERSCTTAQEFDIGPNGAEEILLNQVLPGSSAASRSAASWSLRAKLTSLL